MSWPGYDPQLAESIAAAMDLRDPNRRALLALAEQIARGDGREVIADLATGVGKTYLAAALIDYAAQQGLRDILIVVPGRTILTKTIANFTPGAPKHVPGAGIEPLIVTADNFQRGEVGDALHDPRRLKVYILTVQVMLRPTDNLSRRVRNEDENIGTALYEHLRTLDDLLVIADEHHVYRERAAAFNAAIRDLDARAVVGLTATPDPADVAAGKVVYRYPLADAIADRLVKVPVIAYRADGRKEQELQIADAVRLLERKAPIWATFSAAAEVPEVHPVLFVVAQMIEDANGVAARLAADDLLGPGAVLTITSESSDTALDLLARVEDSDSPIRAIVSVNKLREGWDVKNIGVILALRALASETLTEQVMGRGLRLPFGGRTDVPSIDQLDLVAHESYAELLRGKDALLERLVVGTGGAGSGASGSGLGLGPGLGLDPGPGAGSGSSSGGETGLGRTIDGGNLLPGAESPPEWGAGGGLQPALEFAVPATTLDGIGLAEILFAEEQGAIERQSDLDRERLDQPMPRNADLPPVEFPRERFSYEPPTFSLATLDLVAVEQRGSVYRSEPDVKLIRRAIDAERDVLGAVHVREQHAESVDATVEVLPAEEVRVRLVRRLHGSGLVAAELTEQALAAEVVDAFLRGAGVEGGSHYEWSADLADRADAALFGLVEAAYLATRSRPNYTWDPVTLPTLRGMPAQPYDKNIGEAAFRIGAWYGEWTRGVERYAQFDSATAEFRLVRKLDDWDGVARWLRLYHPGEAWIRWSGGRYFPDFVVVDADGVQWVVEAKSDTAARDSADVRMKAAAAEEWAGRVNASHLFGAWRYLLVTETQIAAASSWAALVRTASAD